MISISYLDRKADDLRQVVQEFKNDGTTISLVKEDFNTGNGNNIFKLLRNILDVATEMGREPASRRH